MFNLTPQAKQAFEDYVGGLVLAVASVLFLMVP